MKLSNYIAALQAILEREGDLEVVKQNLYGDMMGCGYSFESARPPFTAEKFTYCDRQFVKTGMGSLPVGAELSGNVVTVEDTFKFATWGGGGS